MHEWNWIILCCLRFENKNIKGREVKEKKEWASGTCQMGFGLFAGSLCNGAYHGDQVLLLLVLVVVPLQQSLADLHPHAVVQLVGCLLVVKHHVCSTRTKNGRTSEVRLFC